MHEARSFFLDSDFSWLGGNLLVHSEPLPPSTHRARRLLLLAVPALLACPANTVPGEDAGLADAGVSTILDGCLTKPAPPESPRLVDWVCPAGWEAIPTHAVTNVELTNGYAPASKACAPPVLPATCPAGQRAVLGASACATVGDPCPAGDFAPAPAGPVLYVKAGATGGTGSSASSPLGSIAQAVSMAAAGTTIVISKGTYTEYVPLSRAVTLLGACAEQTILTGPSRSATRGTIDVGAAATIKNLTVSGPRPGIWVSFNAEFAVLDGVVVRNAELVGIFVSDNGRAQLDDVLIQDTLVDPANNTLGRGLQVRTGGQVKGAGVTLERNRDVGITLDGTGISADLADLIVRETLSETSSRAFGMGMEVRYGARASVTRGLFEKNRNSAVVSDRVGSRVTLTDVVLQDTLPQEKDNQYGGGLEAAAGVTVDFTRVLVRRMRATGIRLAGAALTATDLAVTDTEGRASDRTQGLGLVLDLQATANLTGAVFANNRIADLLVSDPGSRVTLTDGRMYGVRGQASDGKWGTGFIVMSEAAFDATRLAVEHADDTGGQIQSRSVATLRDLSVRDTGYGGPLTSGDGLEVQSNASVTLSRAAFRSNRRVAVGAHTGSVVQLADLVVRDTATDPLGYFGRAVVAQDGAIVSLVRSEIVRARETAIYAHGPFTQLTVEQTSVLDTQPTLRTNEQEGRAISVEGGAHATVTCFLAQGNREVAANANAFGSRLTLSRVRLIDTSGVESFGDGVAASAGATVVIEDSEVEANQNLGLAFAGAQGLLRRTRIRSNSIGLYVGEGAISREVAEATETVTPLEVQVEQSCVFEGNQTRISGEFVPVPGAIESTPAAPAYPK